MHRQTTTLIGLAALSLAGPALAQHGASNGEWHFYGGDAGTTKYSSLDQIKIVREWEAQNMGKRPGKIFGQANAMYSTGHALSAAAG